jgi:para-nitrobenzyl esterase
MSRKSGLWYKFMALVVALALMVPILAACGEEEIPEWKGDPIVQTQYGAVEGFEAESNTWVWKAIPFAKPPVGELRWKAPQDPEPWEGVRAETEFCEQCTQPDPISREIVGGEDCLYLNVWRPQTEETGLPVYVWIHGGGNSIGYAGDEMYWGANLASKSNMVYVSMNYRLGPLGWFTHPALSTGDKEDDSGNYGTLDIIQALEWVQSNIEAFGGDPNNVIIAGESAGGINVCSLLLSPLAKGLFHKAISESGAAIAMPVEVGEESANDVLLKLLVNDGTAADEAEAATHLASMSDAEIAAYLRSKSYSELHACYETAGLGFALLSFPFLFTDGTVIVADGADAFETGTYPNKVPVILGTNKDETKLFLYFNPAFPDKDGELYQTVARYTSDLWKVAGADGLARKMSSHPDQPDVYVYQFLWGSVRDTGESVLPDPFGSHLGAFHGLDVSFFLGNEFGIEDQLELAGIKIKTEQNRPGRLALQDAIMSYVAQFVWTGEPGTGTPGSNLPRWTPWSNNEGESKCILLDAGYDAIDIKMSTAELTEAGIRAEIDALPEDIAEAIRKASLF